MTVIPFDSDKRAEERARAERENIELYNRIPVHLPSGRLLIDLVRAAGGGVWLSTPQKIEFDAPKTVPKRLRDRLFLHVFLNGRAIAKLLNEEAGA